ncbi:MAG: SidJ-related pseudokinase [Desulfobacteraceae bacterium]
MIQQVPYINLLKACEAIENTAFDFTAKFYAAYDLFQIAQTHVEVIDPRSIWALKGLLLSTAFNGQRQRRFLFREAANVLATIVRLGGLRKPIARLAYDALLAVLYHGCDHAHQAVSEALGNLPIGLCSPNLPAFEKETVPLVKWEALLAHHPFSMDCEFTANGRSLVASLPNHKIAVIKLANHSQDEPALRRELQWMGYLSDLSLPRRCRFDVPQAVRISGAELIQLEALPSDLRPKRITRSKPLAIVFTTSADYYCYPNAHRPNLHPDAEAFVEIMGRNAFLFGWLAGRGIVHEAPIPLFHNRVQQERRRDGGVYEWFRAGRLDRWLASCAYPNFGLSGLRDFEHFEVIRSDGLKLYRHMGNHLLSLLLVAGSYFRAKDYRRRGWNRAGEPVDTRHLFDPDLLRDVVTAIYCQYYRGFVGEPPKTRPPVDFHRLIDRMIDEMGVDRHMTESLRVADQQEMSEPVFEAFLMDRGYATGGLADIQKGVRDLVIHTGPHLGAFNRGISLPEIIEATAAMAAVCIAERFLNEAETGVSFISER